MHSSFSYDGMILLLSSFMKMMSINARIFKGSSSNLFASWMCSSVTFSFTTFDILIFNNKHDVFSLYKVLRLLVLVFGKGCSDASFSFNSSDLNYRKTMHQ